MHTQPTLTNEERKAYRKLAEAARRVQELAAEKKSEKKSAPKREAIPCK